MCKNIVTYLDSLPCPICEKISEVFINDSYYGMITLRCIGCNKEWDYNTYEDAKYRGVERESPGLKI